MAQEAHSLPHSNLFDIPETKNELPLAHTVLRIKNVEENAPLVEILPHLAKGLAHLQGVELLCGKSRLRLAPPEDSEFPKGFLTFDNMRTETGKLVEIVLDEKGTVVDYDNLNLLHVLD